jgi:tetratricopeptide (TPR) repeat protein
MKKIATTLVAFTFLLSSYAQQAKVVTAIRYIKDFAETKDSESLKRAKEAIDLASENADTKELAKTQNTRGQVYLTIFDNNLRLATEKITTVDPNKRTIEGYQNVATAELDEAYTAYDKAKKLDEKGNYKGEILSGLARITSHYENKAIAEYNAKRYAASLPMFEKVNEISGGKDTLVIANCALTAERAENWDKAKIYYQKMIENKQGRGGSYSSLANIQYMLKDSIAGIETIKKGRAAYPNDIPLLISETNYYLGANKSAEAIANLTQAINAKPTDANLYLVRGNAYDNLANPKEANGKDLPKPKDYEEKLKLAESDYKKAIELNPKYFDALYNLGVMYNNKGVAINKMMDKITDNALYAKENQKATDEFNKALPLLESALEANPKDRSTMIALKQLYSRLQMMDKLKAINEKLKGN